MICRKHILSRTCQLLCKIYEDNALGKLPDKRYEFLSHQYETEMAGLEEEVKDLQESVSGHMDGTTSAKKFMALIRRYQDFDKLTNVMANEFIDKIVVHERLQRKYTNHTKS